MANIKQIKVGSTTYDIEALHFITGSLDTPAQWKAYIDSLVGEGLQIVIDTKSTQGDYPATAASASTMGKLYMVQLTNQTESGTYTEFITIKGGTEASPTYSWEKIGTTAADLSEYAKAGTYTSTAPSSNATGSAGGETVDTTDTNLGSATGSAKIDSHSISISAHSHTVNAATTSVGSASGWSAGTAPTRASFTHATGGVKETGGTATALTGVKVSSTTNVNNDAIKEVTLSASDVTTAGPAYVEDVTHTAATLTGTTTFATEGIKNPKTTPSTTSTDGAAYIDSISGSAPSLGGTTTFVTGALKSASLGTTTTAADGIAVIDSISGSAPSLGGTKTFVTGALKSASLGTTTTSTDGIAVIDSISGSAPSLGGTKTFVTGYPNFSGGSASGTFNTDAIKSAALDIKTSATTGYQPVVEEVALSGGSATGTFNTDAIKSIGGTKN